jgi:hypothetical protein
MPELQRTPGRHVTRRLEDPHGKLPGSLTRNEPGPTAQALADAHNEAVRVYGSNSGGWHAHDPHARSTAGVYDGDPFPKGTVVSALAWGRIDERIAQRLLELDGAA